MLYFGYGSNLNPGDLLERAGLVLEPVGRALVCDHRLAFNYRSKSRQGGALSMVPAVGHVVEGVLFDIPDKATWAVLDAKEGARVGCYARKSVTAFIGSSACHAITYVTSEQAEESYVSPTSGYVRVVEDGCAVHGVDPAPMRAAARNVVAAPGIGHVFVYGTLLRGQRLHPHLRTSGAPRAGAVRGRLLDLGMYPALVQGDGRVHGECWALEDLGATLGDLDCIEGFDGTYGTTSLYHRIPIDVDAQGTSLRAWTYRFADASGRGTPIPQGCWRCHQGDACGEAPHA